MTVSRTTAVLAGLALIVLPFIALLVKFVYPGWMLFIMMLYSPVLLIGWATQIVIAANGLLRARGVLRTVTAGLRPIIAAWATSVGVVGVGFFLIDGGDDGNSGSAFTELIGTSSTSAGSDLSMALCLACAAVWVGAWLWLLIEWIAQLVLAGNARRAQAMPV
jgi:hypothetical protein